MRKYFFLISLSLGLTGCGINGPPVSKPAPKDETIPQSYPAPDPFEETSNHPVIPSSGTNNHSAISPPIERRV